MRYKFTDKTIKAILKEQLVVLVDSREQNNKHIIEWFKENKIRYKVQKLDYGDYSFYLESKGDNKEYFYSDVYFDKDIVIERKNSIDELCGNLKDGATRLKTELAHFNMHSIKYFVLLEDKLFDKHLREGHYRSQYNSKVLRARLKSIEMEYNTLIRPIDKEYIASEIFATFYYYARKKLESNNFFCNSISC